MVELSTVVVTQYRQGELSAVFVTEDQVVELSTVVVTQDRWRWLFTLLSQKTDGWLVTRRELFKTKRVCYTKGLCGYRSRVDNDVGCVSHVVESGGALFGICSPLRVPGRPVFTPSFLVAFWGDPCSLRDFWLPFGETCVHSEIPGCLLGANCLSRDHETRQRKHQFYKCHIENKQTKTAKQQTKTHHRLRPLFTLILEVCAHYFVLCGDFLCKTLAFRCPRTLADFTNSNGCMLP